MRALRVCVLVASCLWVVACGGSSSDKGHGDAPQCSDGIDNDGDGKIDFPDDPSCASADGNDESAIAPPQCSDGRDNDGDGKIDYPADPGCFDPQQDSETDDCPDGPNCPQCANGKDDDGNGFTDYPDDPGCLSASDATELTDNPAACGANVQAVMLPTDGHVTGTIDAAAASALSSPTCGGLGGEAVYMLRISSPKVVVATTDLPGTSGDTVLSIRTPDCMTELACDDDFTDSDVDGASSLTYSITTPGIYFLVVDLHDAGVGGTYEMQVNLLAGEGAMCNVDMDCGAGLVCRIPLNGTQKVCSKPVCSDGVDDDGDGKADYPNDPGCDSPTDSDETDDCPSGPNCPACGNGIDDDGDGHTDYPDDTQCHSASGVSEVCQDIDPIASITTAVTTGDTSSAHNDITDATCDTSGTNTAPDLIYRLDLPQMTSLRIATDQDFDAITELRGSTCGGTPIGGNSVGCQDYNDIVEGAMAAGTYYVVVDGYSSDSGTFALTVSGKIAANGSCESPLAQSGALTCASGYACSGTVGSRTCQVALCNDGIDNDGDGKADYPNDPGCDNPSDNDETDDCPTGPNCPVCSNGVDDDGDGHIDYPADTQCHSASSQSEVCADIDPLAKITSAITSGDTSSAHNDITSLSCGSTSNTAPDVTYRLDLPQVSSLRIKTSPSGFDAITALLSSSCTGTAVGGNSVGCEDTSDIVEGPLSAGTYYVIVDGYSTASGPFTLTVSGELPVGGSCEGALAQSGALTCPENYACSGTVGSRTCQLAQCSDGIDNDGDGKIDYPFDPGCASPSDNDEATPATTVCSNAMDDDADGQIDFPADLGCSSAGDTSEALCQPEHDAVAAITTGTVTGTTTGKSNDEAPTCQSSSTAPDVAYALSLPVPVADLEITTDNSTFDTVLSLVDTHCSTTIACDDDGGDSVQSLISLSNVRAGNYAVVIDAYHSNSGAFTLKTTATVAPGTACTAAGFGGADPYLFCPTGTTCTGGTCH